MGRYQSNEIIRFDKVSKYFSGNIALEECSFGIRRGEVTALIGLNGSGKTTVINLISGFLKPSRGKIFLEQVEINSLEPNQISSMGVSRTFQQPVFFQNLSIADNLLVALDKVDASLTKSLMKAENTMQKLKMISSLVRDFGIKFKMKSMPNHLSFGQQKILEITRAIVKPHKIIIMDEPVSGLSRAVKREFEKIFLKMKRNGETILIAEHDLKFVSKFSDRIIVLKRGRVIVNAKAKDFRKGRLFSKIYLGE